MALPTPDSLKNLSYALRAQPFVSVPAKPGVILNTMSYAFQAQPFVANEGPTASAPPKGGSVAAKLVAARVI